MRMRGRLISPMRLSQNVRKHAAHVRRMRQICAACSKARMNHYNGLHCYDPEGDLGQFRAHEAVTESPTYDAWGMFWGLLMVAAATAMVGVVMHILAGGYV
jgi:hypothetical protein